MWRAAKVDANQAVIVETLRAVGATVLHLHTVGQGCPDLLVGLRGRNVLMEIKDGNKPPSARRLTPDEQKFMDEWRGDPPVIALSALHALELIGAI